MAINPLLDNDFLTQLYEAREREVYAKVTLLTLDELPVEDFSGKVTQGTVNLDGTSAVRRTCSLSVVTELDEANSYMWALNSKFKLEVGLKNVLKDITSERGFKPYANYGDIIWFPMGIYFITSFNINHSTTSSSISISGKDKMAMLNGDLGGSVYSLTWDFGSIEITDANGETTIKKYLLENIIREAVHEFAKEPFQNIIINDLSDSGLELLQYNYSKPMYLIKDIKADVITQFTLNAEQGTFYQVVKNNEDGKYYVPQGGLVPVQFNDESFKFDLTSSISDAVYEPTYFTTWECLPPEGSAEIKEVVPGTEVNRVYSCIKAEEGETIGYRTTDLVYAGDLIANVGESITSVLDKIKNMLGDYEYFYNLDGQFVFQRKEISLQHPWNQLSSLNADNTERYVDLYKDNYAYSFDENQIVTSMSNTPAISNVKNDFTVWGEKKSSSGNTKIPVHCRYAIDIKPKRYKTVGERNPDTTSDQKWINQVVYITEDYEGPDKQIGKVRDWRELIYQMALDYRKHMHDAATPDAEFNYIDELLPEIAKNNPEFEGGITGYEQYYVDLEGFWRLLYDPDYRGSYTPAYTINSSDAFNKERGKLYCFENQAMELYDYTASYYYANDNKTSYVYANITNELDFNANKRNLYKPILAWNYDPAISYFYYTEEYYTGVLDEFRYWNKTVINKPEELVFWFDFIDAEKNSDLSKYAVRNIGLRQAPKKDTAVKAVYYRDVPNVIFVSNTDKEEIAKLREQNEGGYTILPLNEDIMAAFTLSVQGKSAKEEIDSMIYNKACCNESITLNCLPIYTLEPNSKVYVKDTKSGINGSYLATRMSINLAYNGMMNVTATKIIDRIY